MLWLFLIVAAVVAAYLGRWAVKERETIRVYHDRIEQASAEAEARRERE